MHTIHQTPCNDNCVFANFVIPQPTLPVPFHLSAETFLYRRINCPGTYIGHRPPHHIHRHSHLLFRTQRGTIGQHHALHNGPQSTSGIKSTTDLSFVPLLHSSSHLPRISSYNLPLTPYIPSISTSSQTTTVIPNCKLFRDALDSIMRNPFAAPTSSPSQPECKGRP